MLKTVTTAIALSLALAALLCGCAAGTGASSTAPSDAYTFTDDTGNTLTVKRAPENVAVLFSSLADIWVTAGGTVSITVGEAVERGFAADGVTLVDEGNGHSKIDLEALTAAEPGLVIGTADYEGQTDAASFCNGLGIPSACFRVESFDDYLRVLNIFCELTGDADRYEAYGTALESQIDGCIERAAAAEPAYRRILFMRSGSSASSAKAKTANEHFAAAMLDELGTENIADGNNVLLDTLSLEVILAENPDYIFITTMGDEAAAKEYVATLFESAGWSSLDAVKNGRYTFLPKELFQFKPNSRWAEAYEYLYGILYPENANAS